MDLLYCKKDYNQNDFLNVKKIIAVSHNLLSFEKNYRLFLEDERIIPAIGLHPQEVKANFSHLAKISELLDQNMILGEIGLDHLFIKDKNEWILQEKVLRFLLFLAEKKNLKLNLHSIGAETEVLNILDTFKIPKVIFHWFNGNDQDFRRIQDNNYFISFGPAIMTSKKIQNFAKKVNISSLLTESDAPFGYKGIIFNPNQIELVVEKIAFLRKINKIKLAKQIYANFEDFLAK